MNCKYSHLINNDQWEIP